MAGNKIQVSLTLNAEGFTANAKEAATVVKNLNQLFSDASKVSSDTDKSIKALGDQAKNITSSFNLLDQTIGSFAAKMSQASERFSSFAANATRTKGSVDGLNSSLERSGSINADRWIENYKTNLGGLSSALRTTVESILGLNKANDESSVSSERAAKASIGSRIKALEGERSTNLRIIEERKKLVTELTALQERLNTREAANTAVAGNYFGKNKALAVPYSNEAAQFREAAAAAEAEAKGVGAVISEIQWKNAEIQKTIELLHAEAAQQLANGEASREAASIAAAAAQAIRTSEQAALIASREAAAERIRLAKQVADEERAQANSIAQMWKSMGQMYAGAKIEKGLGASVDSADQMERQKVSVKSLGYSDEHNAAILGSAENMSKQLQFISTLDAIKSRMSAISSLGYDNAEVIDKTLATAVKAANNLEYLGMSHGDKQNSIKNIYGVVETRQQTQDPVAANQTIDLLQRITTGTNGKVQVSDIETMLRSLGAGANQLTDAGLTNLAAVIDQFKVSGGEGAGGSGAGVATVGTATKMMQAYAGGKTLSNNAVKELAGAGILNTDGMDFSKDDAHVFKDSKNAGFKDAKLWMQDPAAAVQKIMPQIIAFTQNDKNRKKFYGDGDVDLVENQMTAFTKYLNTMGITTKAAQAFMVMGDPRSEERMGHQKETIEGSKGVDGVNDDVMKSYGGNVQKFDAALTNLKVNIGNSVLPMLTSLVEWITNVTKGFAKFAENNPLLTTFETIAAAIGGVVLSLKGMAGLFGLVGNIGTMFSAMAAGTTAAATAANVASSAWASFRAVVVSLGIAFPGLVPAMEAIVAAAASVGSAIMTPFGLAGKAVTGLLGTIGSFASTALSVLGKFVSWVGWGSLAWQFGWVIGEWISSIDVGGVTIGGHMQNIYLGIEVGWKSMLLSVREAWTDFKKFIDGSDFLGESAERKETSSEREALQKYKLSMKNYSSTITDAQAKEYAGMDGHNRFSKTTPKEAGMPAETGAEANKKTGLDAGNSRIAGITDPSKRDPRQFEDLFQKYVADITARSNIDDAKLASMMGKLDPKDALHQQATEEFTSKWVAGDLDKGHDRKNRDFLKDGAAGKSEYTAKDLDLENETVKATIAARTALLEKEEEVKSLTFANERVAATEINFKDALAGGTEETSKHSQALIALEREFARNESRLEVGTKGFKEYAAAKAIALANQVNTDAVTESGKSASADKKALAKIAPTQRGKIDQEFGERATKEKKGFDSVLERSVNADKDAIEAVNQSEAPEEEKQKKIAEITRKGLAARITMEENYNRASSALAVEYANAIKSPLAKMVEEWKDTYKQIQDAEVTWANGFTKNIMSMITTGKADWKGFLESMLTSILEMKLKETMGAQIQGAFSAIGDWVSTNVFGSLSAGATGGLGGTGKDAAVNTNTTATQANTMAIQALTSAVSTGTASSSAAAASGSSSLGSLGLLGGVGKALGFGGGWTSADSAKLSGVDQQPGGGFSGADLVDQPSGGGGFLSSVGDWFSNLFANGGIMSSAGSLPLSLYASGGIANSPQMAVFGEGSMNEAYVPLPDGRSIPVTLNGSAGQSGGTPMTGTGAVVNINVIEGAGTQAQVQQSQGTDGSTQFDVIISTVEAGMSKNISNGRGTLATTLERTYSLNRANGAVR